MSEKKQKSAPQKGRNQHDEFFKKIFKNSKYLMGLLRIIFPPKFVAAFDAASLTIRDSMLLKLGGGEMHTDLTASVRLRGTEMEVTITFILEHKSYGDPEMILQTMEYYLRARREQLKRRSRKKGSTRNLIIPVVLVCCRDKDFEPPKDDLSLEFGDEEIPPILQEFRAFFQKIPCLVVNLRKLPLSDLWEREVAEARERQEGSGVSAGKEDGVSGVAITAVQGMAEVWNADDDTVAALLSKGRLLPPEDGAFILENLNVYYVNADNVIAEGDFNRVDRERWPDLAQEERLEAMLETQSDRAERRGIEQGKQLGIEQGKQLGIEQGRLETAKRLLLDGVDERIICKAAQLSKQELDQIKRSLD